MRQFILPVVLAALNTFGISAYAQNTQSTSVTIAADDSLVCAKEYITVVFKENIDLKQKTEIGLNLGLDDERLTYVTPETVDGKKSLVILAQDCPDENQCWRMKMSFNPETISSDRKVQLDLNMELNGKQIKPTIANCLLLKK